MTTTPGPTNRPSAELDPQTRAQMLRAAAGIRQAPTTAVPMGIRYRTPAAPARAVPTDRRPLWMTLAPTGVLEELAGTPSRSSGPQRRRATPLPPAGRPAAVEPVESSSQNAPGTPHPPAPAPAGAAPTAPPRPRPADRTRPEQRQQVIRAVRPVEYGTADNEPGTPDPDAPKTPAADTPTETPEPGTAGPQPRVLGSYDAYACQSCGSRYGYDVPDHGCGALIPVTVTITTRATHRSPR